MCLLSFSHKKITNHNWLLNSFISNKDGAGFAYAHQNKLVVQKGFFNFSYFLKAYSNIPEDAPNIVHFRASSGGAINAQNTHPFSVSERVAFAHNGILSFISHNQTFSDTFRFNESILKPIWGRNQLGLFTEAAKYLLEEVIGKFNKLAFLNNKGEFLIVNEASGYWEDDDNTWFSNRCYLSDASDGEWVKRGEKWVKVYPSAPLLLQDGTITNNENNQATYYTWLKDCYDKYIAKKKQVEPDYNS